MASQGVSKFTKRSHKKSRNGCTTCKMRRVKCDESHPACSSCLRRNTQCVYNNETRKKSSPTRTSPDSFNLKNNSSYKIPLSIPIPSLSYDSTQPSSVSSSCETFLFPNIDFNNNLDPNFLQPGNNFDSPVSCSSYDERSNLFANFNFMDAESPASLSSMTSASIIDTAIKDHNVTLVSNNGDKIFPSYMNHTKMNNKLLDYYVDKLCGRLSQAPVMIKSWASLTTMGFKYDYLFHIMTSISALSMYHDIAEHNLEKDPLISNIEDLLVVDQMNYNEYLKDINGTLTFDSDNMELFSYVGSNLFHILRFLLSPKLTICDPAFYRIVVHLCDTIDNYFPVVEESPCGKNSGSNYFSIYSTPRIVPPSSSYFPSYLYQLCTINPTQQISDNIYDYSSIQDLLQNDYDKVLPEGDERDLEIDQCLRLAINILKREYVLVFNDDNPEIDPIRVFTRWPSIVPARFTVLLNLHEQRCLIVVAHFLMLLTTFEFETPFARNSIIDEIEKIDSILDKDWKPWLDIPKRVLGMI